MSKEEQELVQLERDFAQAALHSDVAMMDRYTADDFVGIDSNGREITKAQILARFRTPGATGVESLRHDDIKVRVFGDSAVATARTVLKGKAAGQAFAGEYPYMRVWIKREGRWQAVAAMSSSATK